ncbi:uncharacterized protein [Diadema setosum]|uniref:uncharacterized protein n=1 Tax=Diadema setosum TaxID=31175 RepID=UPI003B3B4325
MSGMNAFGFANSAAHVDSDTPPPVLAMTQGLQGYTQQTDEDAFILKLLDNLDPSLILTSPGPTSAQTSFGEQMETDEEMYHAMNPVIPNEPAPVMAPALYAAVGQENPTDTTDSVTNMDTIDAIEPSVRIDSVEARGAMEMFTSTESVGSRFSTGNQPSGRTHEDLQVAVVPPSPRPASAANSVTTSANRHDAASGPSKVRASPSASTSTSSSTSTSVESDPKLPEAHEFKISVRFLGTCVLEETVNKPLGCLVFYKPDSQASTVAPSSRSGLQLIPVTTRIRTEKDGTFHYENMPWQRDSHQKYTQMILQNFDKGLQITTRNGDLFAKRLCNTKLFWTSTQRQDHDAVELTREVETKIFDMQQFNENFKQAYVQGHQEKIGLPAVRFSFAQKWNIDSCSLSTKLVSASIEPRKAGEMVRWINPAVKPAEHYDSYHTSLFKFSHTSTN